MVGYQIPKLLYLHIAINFMFGEGAYYDNGGKVLKIGHTPPGVLVDGEDEVIDPCQEGDQQKSLYCVYVCWQLWVQIISHALTLWMHFVW